ncbi:MAG: EAL domain-containing protein [Actinobacteria bacterium]|uniref:Unannotated protein n=1 Tax=freshwater metagenome TaxID=449393 RepID=A0A6J6YPQ2_9ZZZZ|nr:EAL domain-containing protein [Actinomycetota bacterium]MSX92454.1 EAL domain-containing protein [Actinomycetota bacterium]MSZ82555.1 EAL domain-containing protein [Actinomycetota bacterium]MTB17769.1 EAL domain-containing protein [Actinomycetota bacterium]
MSTRSNWIGRRAAPSSTALETATSIIQNFNDAVVVSDEASRILAINPQAQRLFGIVGAPPEHLDALVPSNLDVEHHRHVATFAATGRDTLDLSATRDLFGRRADGTLFPVVVNISRWEAPDGSVQFVSVVREDARRRLDAASMEWTRLLLTGLLATSSTEILVVDERLAVVAAGDSFRRRFLNGDDPTGMRLPELMAQYPAAPNFDVLFAAVQAVAGNTEVRVTAGTGWGLGDRWFEVVASPLRPGSGVLLEATDVTELVLAARANADRPGRDSATSLLSRTGIIDWIECELAERSQRQLCITMLQIDQFDVIDETLGPRAADELLAQIAVHLKLQIPAYAAAARTDRSTFCIAFPCGTSEEADERSSGLRDAVRQPVSANGRTLRLTASVGATFGSEHRDASRSLREAEEAMLEAHRRGGNRYAPFIPDALDASDGVLRKWNALTEALQFRQMEVWFQPIVRLSNGRPFAAEALSRWHHPQFGEISPVEFIPIAEWGAEISRLGAFVQDRAAEVAMAVRGDRGARVSDLQMSINVSRHELAVPSFATGFLSRASGNSVHPDWFALEVGEDALADDDPTTVSNLQRLAAAGVCITVSDFGSGASSVERLLEIPVTRVKIARRLVASMLSDPQSARVVATAIAMVHELGIDVVAEGVETADQANELIRLGCHSAQGYYFAPAVPATELADVLRDLGSLTSP